MMGGQNNTPYNRQGDKFYHNPNPEKKELYKTLSQIPFYILIGILIFVYTNFTFSFVFPLMAGTYDLDDYEASLIGQSSLLQLQEKGQDKNNNQDYELNTGNLSLQSLFVNFMKDQSSGMTDQQLKGIYIFLNFHVLAFFFLWALKRTKQNLPGDIPLDWKKRELDQYFEQEQEFLNELRDKLRQKTQRATRISAKTTGDKQYNVLMTQMQENMLGDLANENPQNLDRKTFENPLYQNHQNEYSNDQKQLEQVESENLYAQQQQQKQQQNINIQQQNEIEKQPQQSSQHNSSYQQVDRSESEVCYDDFDNDQQQMIGCTYEEEKEIIDRIKMMHQQNTFKKENQRYCKKCKVFKPDRTHHCSQCRKCVLKMDHHCQWVDNCIGFYNYKYFVSMLFFASVTLVYISVNYIQCYLDSTISANINIIRLFMIALMFYFSLILTFIILFFCSFHLWLIFNNKTTIEWCEKKKDSTTRKYDIGCCGNIKQNLNTNFMFWLCPININTEGDGLDFPINKSYGKY